jgi:hypothetical protein
MGIASCGCSRKRTDPLTWNDSLACVDGQSALGSRQAKEGALPVARDELGLTALGAAVEANEGARPETAATATERRAWEPDAAPLDAAANLESQELADSKRALDAQVA